MSFFSVKSLWLDGYFAVPDQPLTVFQLPWVAGQLILLSDGTGKTLGLFTKKLFYQPLDCFPFCPSLYKLSAMQIKTLGLFIKKVTK